MKGIISYSTNQYNESMITDVNNSINNIEIGGRNLAIDTNTYSSKYSWEWKTELCKTEREIYDDNGTQCIKLSMTDYVVDNSYSIIVYSDINTKIIEPSTKYTISFKVFPSVNTDMTITLNKTNASNGLLKDSITVSVEANKWNNVSVVVETKDTITIDKQVFYLYNMNSDVGTSYIFKDLIITRGTKASDWNLAPEDTQFQTSILSIEGEDILAYLKANHSKLKSKVIRGEDCTNAPLTGSNDFFYYVDTITNTQYTSVLAINIRNNSLYRNTMVRGVWAGWDEVALNSDLNSVKTQVIDLENSVNDINTNAYQYSLETKCMYRLENLSENLKTWSVDNKLPNNTTYRFSAMQQTGSDPILGGGNVLVEGHKYTDLYEWQKATCYGPGRRRILFRDKYNGVWSDWGNFIVSNDLTPTEGTVVTNSITSGSTVTVNTLNVEAGTYIIVANAKFTESFNYQCNYVLTDTSRELAMCRANGTNGGGQTPTSIATFTSSTTVYFKVYQGSGSTRTLDANKLTAIRLY